MKNNKKLLIKLLSMAGLMTAAIMTGFEFLKQIIHADISIWESHVLTIIFTTFVAVTVTYIALRQHYSLLKVLSGFIPICSYCKKIRDEEGNWTSFEEYIGRRSHAEFTHGVCGECSVKVLEEAKRMKPSN